jgi:hypothetical protein
MFSTGAPKCSSILRALGSGILFLACVGMMSLCFQVMIFKDSVCEQIVCISALQSWSCTVGQCQSSAYNPRSKKVADPIALSATGVGRPMQNWTRHGVSRMWVPKFMQISLLQQESPAAGRCTNTPSLRAHGQLPSRILKQ